MKFTHKIMLSPLVTGVAFLLIFTVTQRAAQHSSQTIARIQDEFFHATELSHDLQIELLTLRHLLTEAATNGNEDALLESADLAARFRATAGNCRDVPELSAMIAPLIVKFDRYYDVARRTTERMVEQAGALDLVFDPDLVDDIQRMNQSYAELSRDIGVVVASNNEQLAAAIADTRARIGQLRVVLNVTSVVFLVLLVALSGLAIGSIVRPVHRMSRLARAISGGDLGQNLDYRSGDALGELADSIREMQASLIRDVARREEAESDLIAAQGQVIQSEKMAALGKLVAGLTHELNSPLGTMTSSVDVLRRSRQIYVRDCDIEETAAAPGGRTALVRANVAMEKGLASLAQAAARIEELVNGLKVFSQLDKGEVQQTDINAGLRATLDLIDHELPAGLEIVCDLGELDLVLAYPIQLNQALMALIRHSVRDITPPGTVTISTGQVADQVRIEITDTGCGYQPDALLALFNPSFRADTSRMRMDWDMVSSIRIVERHHGSLTAKSDPGQGTRYVVEIPIWSEFADSAPQNPLS